MRSVDIGILLQDNEWKSIISENYYVRDAINQF